MGETPADVIGQQIIDFGDDVEFPSVKAANIIAALHAAGYEIVPSEPTEKMRIAGLETLGNRMEEIKHYYDLPENRNRNYGSAPMMPTSALLLRASNETDATYRAMVAARPYRKDTP